MGNRDFSEVWKRFTDLCRGALSKKSDQGTLTPDAARIAVKTTAGMWTDPYTECGRWLKKLRESSPEKAEAILQLIEGISFEEIPVKSPVSDMAAAAAALGAAAVGAGVSARLLNQNIWVSLISAAVPAVILYPSMKTVQSAQKQNNKSRRIEGYMEQLSLIEEQIRGIIEPRE